MARRRRVFIDIWKKQRDLSDILRVMKLKHFKSEKKYEEKEKKKDDEDEDEL